MMNFLLLCRAIMRHRQMSKFSGNNTACHPARQGGGLSAMASSLRSVGRWYGFYNIQIFPYKSARVNCAK